MQGSHAVPGLEIARQGNQITFEVHTADYKKKIMHMQNIFLLQLSSDLLFQCSCQRNLPKEKKIFMESFVTERTILELQAGKIWTKNT